MSKQRRNTAHRPDGNFARTRFEWNPDKWDDGVVGGGRMHVYRPDCPRAVKSTGYAIRAHVVYWLATGECHPKGMHLHHKNGNPLDDRIENLEVLTPKEHSRIHNLQTHHFVCKLCGKDFTRTGSEVAKVRWLGKEPQFCSNDCRMHAPKSEETRRKMSEGLRKRYAADRVARVVR